MAEIFRRPQLAQQMARQLLHPGVLDEGLRSGLFLSGLRRTGKTTFLRHDLIPALERQGAVVIYVDLWSDTKVSPAALVQAAVRQALADLLSPSSALLAQVFREVVDQARADVVLIVDEVQQAITSDEGNQMLLALKAARDAINPRPDTPGHFLFIGTGSHRALVSELTARRNQAFAGATSLAYPVLDRDYVQHVLQRLAAEGMAPLPSLSVATASFQTLGHRPEELLRALHQMHRSSASGVEPDQLLPVIAATLRSAAADIELLKVEQLGSLAVAIFDRVACAPDGQARGLFSAEAAAAYAQAIGREVRIEEIQPVVNELLAANVLMRLGHGLYGVTDPFVQEIWLERQALLA